MIMIINTAPYKKSYGKRALIFKNYLYQDRPIAADWVPSPSGRTAILSLPASKGFPAPAML